MNSESESLSEAMSEAESSYDSASTSFSEGAEDDYLENLIKEIEEARAELEAVQRRAIRNGQYLNHDDRSNNYYGYGDKLANLLIQYSFYQEGYVGEILYSDWDFSNYNTNGVKVTYIDAAGETKYAYFDYVTVDKAGNALVPGFYDSPSQGKEHDNPNVVSGIMVVKKTNQYTDANGNVLTWKYETETAADGTESTVCRYYVNGQQIADDVKVTIKEDDSFTLSWNSYNGTTKNVVAQNNNPWSNIYYSEDGQVIYHDLGSYTSADNIWNGQLSGVCRNSADNTLGVVVSNSQGVGTYSTLTDGNGNTVSYNNQRIKIGGKTYFYRNSRIVNNGNGTYTFTATIDDHGASNWTQTVTLYTSASSTSYSVNFKDSFVAKAKEDTDVYFNNAGQAKDGNFGVKGYTYFSINDFDKGKDDYAHERSEFTSVSDSVSETVSEVSSESDSWTESISESAKASESSSASRSESMSESASASNQSSQSRSESLSESASASAQTSESRSQSLSESVKASESASLSRSESVSASNSASASMSQSISESLSASLSQYISES
ncbi:MAG: hypothetical protein VZR64_11255, partial [Eubacterium sp.]|nr:hypothetical protein [Eubacterium sp.]